MSGKNEIVAGIRLDGEKEFKQGVTDANKSLMTMKSELSLVKAQYDGQANSLSALTAKHEVLNRILNEQKRKVEATKAGLENANRNYEESGKSIERLWTEAEKASNKLKELEQIYGKSSDEAKRQQEQVNKLTSEIGREEATYRKAGNSVNDWQKKLNYAESEVIKANKAVNENAAYMREAEKATDNCATSIDKFGKKTSAIKTDTFMDTFKANVFSTAATRAFDVVADGAKKAAKYVVEVGSDFTAAMSEVQAISGAGADALSQMEEKAKALGSSTKFSATEVANGFKYMSLAGWSTNEMLSGIDGVLNLAAASGMELAEASDMVTDYLSAFGMEASESAKMADMMAFAQANSNTSAQQLGEAYGNCAADLNAAGQDIETTTSLLEGMANQGRKGSEAGTQLSAIMRDITSAMKDGEISIGDTSVKVMDANGDFRDLTDILTDVESATEGMGTAQKKSALSTTFTARSMTGLNLILNEGMDNISGYEDSLRNCDGAAERMAATMEDNLKGDITEASSALEGLGIAAYNYVEGPLRSVVQGATGFISGITDAITPQRTALETFIDDIKASNDEVQELLGNAESTMTGAEMDASNLEAYKQTLLSLNEVEHKNEYQKYQVKTIVDKLSSSIPELSAAFNEETGNINLTSTAIETLIDKQKEAVIAQAALKAQADASSALFEAELNARKAANATEEARKQLADMESIENLEALVGVNEDLAKQYVVLESTLKDAEKEEKKANELKAESQKQYEQISEVVEEAGENTLEYAKSLEETSEAANGAAGSVDGLNTTEEEAAAAAEAAAQAAELQKSALESVKQKYDEFRSQLESDIQNKISLFDSFDGGTDMTMEAMLTNLQSQKTGLETWRDNMETLAQEIGTTISPEFYNAILEMGPEGANAVQHMVDTIEKQSNGRELMKQMSDEWVATMELPESISRAMENTKIALDAGLREMGSTPADFSELKGSIETAASSAAEGWNTLTDDTRTALNDTIQIAESCGIQIPEGLAQGIASGEIGPEAAMQQLNSSIRGTIDGLIAIAKENGIEIPEEITAGIEAGGGGLLDAYNGIIQKIAQSGISSETEKAGEEAAEGFVSGMENADTSPSGGKGKEIVQPIADEIKNDTSIKEAISTTVKNAVAGVTENTEEYRQAGAELGKAVAEGMKEAQEDINSALSPDTENISGDSGVFREAGGELGKAVAEGMGEAQEDINHALTPDVDSISSSRADYEAAGAELASAVVFGMESTGDGVPSKMSDLVKDALEQARNKQKDFDSAGSVSAAAYAAAISGQATNAYSAAAAMAAAAVSAANNYTGNFQAVGYNMAAGTAAGIRSGSSQAINAAANMAAQALAAAKNTLGIRSPSRKFRKDVGWRISEGMAFGISDKKSLASKSAAKMSAEVYSEATTWMKKYKKSHKTSLDDEVYFWKQVRAHTKKGTDAYNKTVKQLNKLTLGTGSVSLAKKIQSNFGVSKTKKSGKETVEKSSSEYYSDILQAAEKYMKNYQVIHKVSLEQEKAYWANVKKNLKKGSQAWYDATEKINDLQGQIQQAAKDALTTKANVQDDILDKYKVYYKVSAKAEKDYWDAARKQFKTGTDERIAADQKYFEAQQAWYDQRKELDEEYAENSKTINEELAASVEELQNTYKDAVKSRKQDILSQMNLFEAWDSSGYDANTLLYNLKTQVAGLTLWEQQLEELGKKGLTSALMDELKEMGPDAAASIYSLNQMTAEQLKEYSKLWEQKNALAESQAVKENEPLRADTNKQIEQLKADAKKELDALNAEYKSAINELNAGLSSDLSKLLKKTSSIGEDAVSGLIAGIGKAVNSVETYNSTTKVVSSVSGQLSTLQNEGKIIGKNTLDGILEGLTDYKKIEVASQKVIQSIKQAMKEDGIMNMMLDSANMELERKQAALQEQMAALNFAGVARINDAMAGYTQQSTVIVDNSGILSAMERMFAGMETMIERMESLQVVMDTGTIVGELQPTMSRESAAITVRKNRGRL